MPQMSGPIQCVNDGGTGPLPALVYSFMASTLVSTLVERMKYGAVVYFHTALLINLNFVQERHINVFTWTPSKLFSSTTRKRYVEPRQRVFKLINSLLLAKLEARAVNDSKYLRSPLSRISR